MQGWPDVCHVLIIEDEILIALDIEDILSRLGATSFDLVDTEQAAIDAAEAHRPDFIAADVILRIGFGYAAVEAIVQRLGPIPTIFITATPETCPVGDLAHVLGKPLNELALAKAFRALRA
jgi:CheY-like chemotaxis protein